jgi:N utilization substance protein B
MAVLDRLILRMAACELLRDPKTPPAVIINEALELTRTFSTEDAVKFVNGMLDGIRKKVSLNVAVQTQRAGPEPEP